QSHNPHACVAILGDRLSSAVTRGIFTKRPPMAASFCYKRQRWGERLDTRGRHERVRQELAARIMLKQTKIDIELPARAGASSYTTNWPATSIFIPAVSTSWTCTKTSGPRALHRAEDIGSALKGSVNVCQRQLVNEVLGPLVTKFVRNFGRKG